MSTRQRSMLHRLRRQVTTSVTHGAVCATRILPEPAVLALGRNVGRLGRVTPLLRSRLRHNFECGLGAANVAPDAVSLYFQRFGQWSGWSLAAMRHGFADSCVPQRLEFDDSVSVLDEAVALGRGVVLASPHFFGHELAAAFTGLRHPVTGIVRENRNARRQALKTRWYRQLGMGTVLRPRGSTVAGDMAAALRILRDGQVLGITPDVVVPPDQGMAVSMLGHQVNLPPGAILLAMRARCPVVTPVPVWNGSDRAFLHFTSSMPSDGQGDRQELLAAGFRRWCEHIDGHIRQSPQDWMFWLDKRWTQTLQGNPTS